MLIQPSVSSQRSGTLTGKKEHISRIHNDVASRPSPRGSLSVVNVCASCLLPGEQYQTVRQKEMRG